MEVFGAFVLSTVALGEIVSIDATTALVSLPKATELNLNPVIILVTMKAK